MADETDLQYDIVEYLVAQNFVVIRINGGRRGKVPFYYWTAKEHDIKLTAGVSDLIAFSPNGKPYLIECKSKSGKTSKSQRTFIDAAFKRNITVIVPSKLEDVMEAIG